MSARDFAFQVLRRWAVLHDPPFVPEREDRAWAAVPPRERAFAFDLITGIIRWRNALDAVIASRLTPPPQPIESLDLPVRAVLWLGAYQLLFQETAGYAAVDTTVKLAKKTRATAKASGLVNAVLRGITRLAPRRGAIDRSKPAEARLARRSLALDFATELQFNADIFPDPATATTAHLAAVRSHPALLVDHWRKIFGDALAGDLLLRNNQRPVITLRADADALDVPAAAGLVAHESAKRFLVAAQGWNEPLHDLVSRGILSPQDPTSAKPVHHLQLLVSQGVIPAPQRILDLCAGLGTKTLQLARAFPETAIFATDIDPAKLDRLVSRAKQVGQKNISTVSLDSIKNQKSKIKNPFDAVLVDVPCSNTGVLARRAQSRWRWPTLDRAALAELQRQLLEQAVRLAPRGTIIYSTCSIDPAENNQRIGIFPDVHADYRLLHEELTLPSLDIPGGGAAASHDGGYFSIIRHAP